LKWSAGADLPGAKVPMFIALTAIVDPGEVVRRSTQVQVEQRPVPPELSMVSPELLEPGSSQPRSRDHHIVITAIAYFTEWTGWREQS